MQVNRVNGSRVFGFRGFLSTLIPEILKIKNLCNESSIKLAKSYYFEILVLKYLEIPGKQTPLERLHFHFKGMETEFLPSNKFLLLRF